MIDRASGDVLAAGTEAVVNSVNCQGVMGRGIARQFKDRFPENFRRYKAVCDRGDLTPGDVFVHDRGGLFHTHGDAEPSEPRFIVNLATLDHWTDRARLDDVQAGIAATAEEVQQRGISSIAIPPVGCGYGGLDWADVEAAITDAFTDMEAVRVLLYPPS